MQNESAAEMESGVLPQQTGVTASVEDLLVRRRIRVDGIYTFFYQEREKGFLFPGESHSMLEMTYLDQGALHSVVDGQDTVLKNCKGQMVVKL
jgi:hypothetical protein